MVVDTKTSAADRATMQGLLAQHFQLGPRCRHSSLPRLGDSSWFKNAFLEHAAADWQDSWFEADGSAHEMIELAEMLAALT